jgi:hypothetical protein
MARFGVTDAQTGAGRRAYCKAVACTRSIKDRNSSATGFGHSIGVR